MLLSSATPSPITSALRELVSPLASHRVMAFDIDALDIRLRGGLRAGALHEAAAADCSMVDEAAATLFLAGVAAREAERQSAPVLWVCASRDLYAPGLAQAGLVAANVIYVHSRDDAEALAVMEDAVRDGTPAAVVGEVRKLPMVASRRLQLAAADADTPVLLLRQRRRRTEDPFGDPSAAWTRWRIASAPSARLDVPGVGRARWSLQLVRQRGGEGFSLIVEGSDETGRLAVPAALGHRAAETAGAPRAAAA